MSDELYFNGIDAVNGGYLLPPLTAKQVSALALGKELEGHHLAELKKRAEQPKDHYGVKEGVNPKDLAQAGWGVIFAHGADPAIQEALGELLRHRQAQAGERYKEYSGVAAYRPNESKSDWLARHGMGPGPADPDKVPYYLLIVGDPETIPYRFQYQLDVQYAVGRIDFESLEEYAQYARSVVAAETSDMVLSKQAAFFGVQNADDKATQLSAKEMVKPLAEGLAKDQPDWSIRLMLNDEATKANLAGVLGGADTPALLFSASHGVGFPNGDVKQLPHQGALLCQDWPGPNAWRGAIPEEHYFAGSDVGSDARLLGLIAFFFACYGGGTPRFDEFTRRGDKRVEIAPRSFMARLPQRLLGHAQGGALAVVSHVDRAWGYSFMWDRAGRQTEVFNSALKRLMEGHPLGSALEYFNQRYAELSSDLSNALDDPLRTPSDVELAGMWTANNDARSYAVLGDPAVRLLVASDKPALAERPVMVTKAASAQPATAAAKAPVNVLGGLAASLRKAAEEIDSLAGAPDAPAGSSEAAAGYDRADEVLRRVRREIEETTAEIAARRKQR